MDIPTRDQNPLATENEALDQSIALSRIAIRLLHDRATDCKRLWIALVVSILINLALVGLFLWHESQWECVTTETTTVTQDTGEGNGNNIYQAGENAIYNQSTSNSPKGGE